MHIHSRPSGGSKNFIVRKKFMGTISTKLLNAFISTKYNLKYYILRQKLLIWSKRHVLFHVCLHPNPSLSHTHTKSMMRLLIHYPDISTHFVAKYTSTSCSRIVHQSLIRVILTKAIDTSPTINLCMITTCNYYCPCPIVCDSQTDNMVDMSAKSVHQTTSQICPPLVFMGVKKQHNACRIDMPSFAKAP